MIAIGSDHGGYYLKEQIKKYLDESGYEYKDFGCYSTDECDYPEVAEQVAVGVSKGEYEKGILICGTGIGISIAANKVKGIRASLCNDCFSARMSREHNNANILTIGERVVGFGLALEIVDVWLKSEFIGGKHKRRVDKLTALEQKHRAMDDVKP